MAPRPQWKGYLKLSLVSCAVALYPATTTSTRTRFHTLNQKTGHRVRRQFIDAETSDVVETEDQVRGYEVAKNSFVIIEDEDLEAIALESTHTIDIDCFVDHSKVDQRFLDTPYYLAPNDSIAQQAFAIIRDAMRRKGVVGLARVVLNRRERLVLLEPYERGMLATLLLYNYEVRDAAPYYEDIETVELPPDMLDLATHIIERKSGDFDLARFEDRYENALVALVREKQKGQPIIRQASAPAPSNVVNLMEALRLSLGAGEVKPERREPKPGKRPARTRAGKARLRKAS